MKTGASLYMAVSKLGNCKCYLHYQQPAAFAENVVISVCNGITVVRMYRSNF